MPVLIRVNNIIGSSLGINRFLLVNPLRITCCKVVPEWNPRVFLLVCVMGLAIDPLFFYTLTINNNNNNNMMISCLFIDGWLSITVTVLRCITDMLHLWNYLILVRLNSTTDHDHPQNYHSSSSALIELGGGDGRNNAHSRLIHHLPYFWFKRLLLLDLFVILPVPQVTIWAVAPTFIANGRTTEVMTLLLVTFLFQYIPKLYYSTCLLRRMHVFGTIWWGFALNMIAYFVASHAAGACWYLLGIQRAAKCLSEQCAVATNGCDSKFLGCKNPIYYGGGMFKDMSMTGGTLDSNHARDVCLMSGDNFNYGAYKWVVPLVTSGNWLEKILFPIFWGLMTLSTFGNLASTTEWTEVVFNIVVLTSGLILVTMLIGNIKVFLNAKSSKKQAMQLKMRNLESWMRRRQLPQGFRQRVRQYERQRWAAMRGVDECDMIKNLPEGLRRDIKYHLCLDLVRQVPLFQHMDDLVLEHICDRVKSLIFPKGETIIKEGEPVHRMLFVVRGHLQSSQVLRDGVKSCCMLGPGNFSGDELLCWCLRRPFVERLPPSSSTLISL